MPAILVVDDESAMRVLYGRLLLAEGHFPLEARTAEEALEMLSRHDNIAVVIADLQMPGHGGDWLIERIRERFPNVAVILSTANQSVPGSVTLQPSVVNYIVKPVSAKRLIEAVNNGLSGWDQAQAPPSTSAADPIEEFLDSKLNRVHGIDRKRG
jgi:DNA-binding NtrC family response regulator